MTNNSQHENLVVRAATMNDLGRLLEMSQLVGSGMTSMPTDRQSWVDKLERSTADFNQSTASKSSDIYFMVLEDLQTGNIVGSGAVYQGIGIERPFYSYKMSTLTGSSEKLDLTVHTRLLSLVNDFSGTTEIGSLFLLPDYRRDGIGKFLSRSRFLLLGDFPERFDETVFAEMRGWLNDQDESPFWDALGKKFFGLSFKKADFISAVDGFQFISDLMPKYPVYLDLLSEEAQSVVGKPHRDAAPAFKILEKEGFKFSGYIDIFDAGPTVAVNLEQIKTIKDSNTYRIGAIEDNLEVLSQADDCHTHIISNGSLPDYRVTRAPLRVNEDATATISSQTAEALQLELGASVRAVIERPPILETSKS